MHPNAPGEDDLQVLASGEVGGFSLGQAGPRRNCGTKTTSLLIWLYFMAWDAPLQG